MSMNYTSSLAPSTNASEETNVVGNSTGGPPTKYIPQFDLGFHSILLIIAIFIILTNGLVIILFRTGRLWRGKSNYLLLSLSVSDMSTGIVTIPLNISCESTNSWNYCLLSFEMNRFIGISTISHIFMLTLEKYLAVMHPMLHRRILTKKNVVIAIATSWLVSLVIALVPLEWLLDLGGVRNRFSESALKKQTIHETFVFVFFFAFPLATMFVCYARMLSIIVVYSFSSAGKQAKESTPCNVSRYRRFKPMLLFIVMLLIFILSWGWWYFGTIQRANHNKIPPIPTLARSILIIVRYSSSFINPLLYTFFKRDFKLAFRRLMLRLVTSAPNSTTQINLARPREKVENEKHAQPPHGNNKVAPQIKQPK